MKFAGLLDQFVTAVEKGDGKAFAALFCENGSYTDCFYGTFSGRDAIKVMLEERFWRDGTDLKWEMFDPLADGIRGYARFLFSFTSKLSDCEGRRVVVDGMSFFELKGDLIYRYQEVVAPGIAMVQLGFPPDKIANVLSRYARDLRQRPDLLHHLKVR